ncbi:hypothetical protein ABFS82_13G006300 [Erythranthe guttata]|uniref:CCT domain-containing protein n=1 Tax=Erythranthe guttata TaxID=4155 RepID=A0A022RV22_ERYGU|nr:PREDICTED: zinc finger protein CONSTANS-LIKE 9 [Erythranthe guttata]EYU42795.1 hypothetical protein MIMGU_mgv1a007482mg [Erythranthe guttata]|eukprot:XP_012830864.1 PREDICTED: zinc finger protein CONSTANS-LIKE 9 [Erythranthe guttata]
MGYLCEFCGEQRSIVYCQSDAASLCLSCDRNIHSANALSKRHSRTLVCERCNSQPAFVRCVEEKVSLCRNCDWMEHGNGSNVNTAHKRQAVNCYTGCPSASELSANWSFLLDSTCEQGINLLSITDKTPPITCENSAGKNNNSQVLGESNNVDADKSTEWMDSLTPLLDHRLNVDHRSGSTSSSAPKVFLSGAKGPAVCEDGGLYDDLCMDEVDLNIENYEELFGVAYDNPELFGYDGIDEIFGTKDMSGSNCHGAYAAEGSSIGGANVMQSACSNAESADSFASCKTEPNLRYSRQLHQTLSFSGINGEIEINGGDFQDCGVSSSMAIAGEPPWYPPGPDSSLPSTSRTDAVMRYREKKKARKFEKKVRYESRKARADVRRRVKGRFVKAGDAYDYDPLSPSRSF